MQGPGPAALCSTSFTIPPPLPSRGRAAVLQCCRMVGTTGEHTCVDVNVCVTSFPFLPGLVGAVLLLYRTVTGCRNTWYRLPRSASSSPGGQANVRLHGPQCLHSPHCPLLQWPVLAGTTGRISQPSYHPSSSHVSSQLPAAGCGSRELTHFSHSLPRREKCLAAAAASGCRLQLCIVSPSAANTIVTM